MDFLKINYKKFDQANTFEYSFLDYDFKNLYKSEERMGQLFWIFSFLAIFVACLGLYGLISYSAVQKTKEIGCTMKVRHGASDNLHESVYKQLVSVNQFSQAGTLEGDTIATYSGNLINKGKTVEIEAIMTEGVVPDFL